MQLAVVKDRLGLDAAHGDAKRMGGEGDSPTGHASKHADRGDQHGAIELFHRRRCSLGDAEEESPHESGYQDVPSQPAAPRRVAQLFRLEVANLGVDLGHRLAVCGPDDPLQNDGLALPPSLHAKRDVDVVEQDEPIPPVAIGVQVLVLVDRPGAAVDDEACEGQALARSFLDLPDAFAGFCDIDFDKAMDVVLSCGEVHAIDNQLPEWGERLDHVCWFVTHKSAPSDRY